MTASLVAVGGRTVGSHDRQSEIRDFLASRRARISPEQAGVPVFGGSRRVPGLRREEVAHLAGVSVDYYTRIERGKIEGASPEVLEAIARALQLDDVERDHLRNLIRARQPRPSRRRTASEKTLVRLQLVVDAITVPAFVQNPRLDIVAANAIGKAVYSLPADGSGLPHNHLLFQFLDPRAGDFYEEPDLVRHNGVALLRAAAGRDPHDEQLMGLVGRLSMQSEEFRTLWGAHDVLRYRGGAKRYNHPTVGRLEFGYESFEVSSEPGLTLMVYSVEPQSATAEALALLASWTALPAAPDPGNRRSDTAQ
jgi:PAS domain-containing protein